MAEIEKINFKTNSWGIFASFFIGIGLILFQDFIPVNESILAWEFNIFYLLGLFTIWISAKRRLTPYILFYLTCGLFIGGRFFAVGFGYDEESIFQPTFFYSYYVDNNRKIELMRYVIGFFLMNIIGFVISKSISINKLKHIDFPLKTITISHINTILRFLFPIFMLITVYYSGSDLIRVLKGGYLALYIGRQTDSYSAGASIFLALNNAFFGIAMGYGDKKVQKWYILLFVIRALVEIIIGSRRSFGAMLLVFLWMWSSQRKVSTKRLGLALLGCCAFLILVASFSIRALTPNSTMLNYDKLAYSFLYSQGITLMVFDSSRLIYDYPVIGYFNNLFPGTNAVYNLFSTKVLYPQDIDWSNWMCYQFNSKLFSDGAGLGWSIMSDLYMYANRTYLFFLILSAFWSFFVGIWERVSEFSRFLKSWLFMVIMSVVIIPRSSMGSIFPHVYYLLIFFTILILFIQIANLNKSCNHD